MFAERKSIMERASFGLIWNAWPVFLHLLLRCCDRCAAGIRNAQIPSDDSLFQVWFLQLLFPIHESSSLFPRRTRTLQTEASALCPSRIWKLLKVNLCLLWPCVQTCNRTPPNLCPFQLIADTRSHQRDVGLLSIPTRLPKLDVRPNLAGSVHPKLIKLVLWECFHTTSMSTQIQLSIPGPVSALELVFKSWQLICPYSLAQ